MLYKKVPSVGVNKQQLRSRFFLASIKNGQKETEESAASANPVYCSLITSPVASEIHFFDQARLGLRCAGEIVHSHSILTQANRSVLETSTQANKTLEVNFGLYFKL